MPECLAPCLALLVAVADGGVDSRWCGPVPVQHTDGAAMLRWDQPADHTLPPHEVKLYALDMARTIHEWADLQDICAIVEAKSLPDG
jgi:hypothetical protein